MRKGALLQSVAKNGHGLAAQQLVHEDADHIAIAVANVLALAIHVVRTKYHIVHAEHLVGDSQLLFHGEFRNPVRIFRKRNHRFRHGALARAVDRDG